MSITNQYIDFTVEIRQLPEKPQPISTQRLETFLQIFQDLLQSSGLFCSKPLLHFQPSNKFTFQHHSLSITIVLTYCSKCLLSIFQMLDGFFQLIFISVQIAFYLSQFLLTFSYVFIHLIL